MKLPCDEVVAGVDVAEVDAVAAVGGDDVRRARGRAADRVAAASELMLMPAVALPRASVPLMSVPIRLPWIRLNPAISELRRIPDPGS